jgi:hypothetical protein
MATVVAQPQTSRAGLITTIVISLILNVLLAVVYFRQYNDFTKLQTDFSTFTKKYADAVTESALSSADYSTARDQAKAAGNLSVYDLLSSQRSDLATAIVGTPMASPEARDQADAARKDSNAQLDDLGKKIDLKVTPGNSLVETLTQWPKLVQKAIDQREQANKDLQAANDKLKAADAANQQALAEKDKAIADAKAETAKANDQVTQMQQAQSKALGDVQAGANQSIQTLTQQLTSVQAVIAQKDQAIGEVNKKIVKLMSALRKFKANPTTKDDIIRVADGEIKTVAGNQCFINLGQGDQIYVGMTFEVYDPAKGIPPLGDGTSNPEPVRRGGGGAAALAGVGLSSTSSEDKYEYELPKGKGSIEVINIGADHTSQCRIIHTEQGQTISQGDIIANLVYDRNIKYNFVVYGDFDLANSNASVRANDAPVIRRLIEQWGGHVQPIVDPAHPADAVTPETDFVIVGKEPVIPNFTAEELNDPGNALIAEKAKGKQDSYRAVLAKAADYGVPVMNQNRFLYFTGYYDQARR